MRGSEIHLKNAVEMLLVEYQKYRISKGDASALRSEVKDFFDFAIDPILLVRKQKGLEKQLLVILYASSYHMC